MVNKSSIFKSPLRYPGGKACIFKFVTKLLKENDLVGTCYAEPYAGGAGLALRLLMDGYVKEIYINDYDPSIFALWYAILNHPDEMCRWIEDVTVDVKHWTYYREIQREKDVDRLELAKSTFFLNRTNVSGVISGGPIGGMTQMGRYKIDARFNKIDLISRIENITQYISKIHLSNQDGIVFVKELENGIDDYFIYLDPPYYQKGSDLYLNAFKDEDHRKLSDMVKSLTHYWMVSYDNHNFILNLYENNHKVIYRLSQCTSNRTGDEVLIFDDRLKFLESMNNLKMSKQV